MPTNVIDNIKGRELPAEWQRKLKIIPDESYSVTVRPQKEGDALKEIVEKMRETAEKRGLTPEILADALGVDVETVR